MYRVRRLFSRGVERISHPKLRFCLEREKKGLNRSNRSDDKIIAAYCTFALYVSTATGRVRERMMNKLSDRTVQQRDDGCM